MCLKTKSFYSTLEIPTVFRKFSSPSAHGTGKHNHPFRNRKGLGKVTHFHEVIYTGGILPECLFEKLKLSTGRICLGNLINSSFITISIETKVELVLVISYEQGRSGLWTSYLISG